MFDVEFFIEDNGRIPVEEFITGLKDRKMKAKIFRSLELLERNGNMLGEPYSAFLGDGIYELRIIQSSNISRILYFFCYGKKIILTNGFIKKTQKTPIKEIKLAKKEEMIISGRKEKTMGKNYRETLNELMKDPGFKKEWDALEPECQIIRAMIDARNEKGITQKELSSITGITQGDISKLENGTANPSIRTLQRIAQGLGKSLVIQFK